MRKFWASLTTVYMAVLMYASLTTQIEKFKFIITDLLHMPAYAVLTLLLIRTDETRQGGRKYSFVVPFLIAVIYGAVIEVLQGYTGRNPSWSDVGLNIAGAAGTIAWIKWS